MKCLLFLVLCVFHGSVALETQVTSKKVPETFKDDVRQILQLIPREVITEIVKKHLETDDGFKAALNYMKTDQWAEHLKLLTQKPEWIRLKEFLLSIGFPIDTFVFCLETFIENVPVFDVPEDADMDLSSFLGDVEKAIPLSDIIIKFHEIKRTSQDFDEVLKKLRASDTKILVENVIRLQEMKKFLIDLRTMGFKLEDFFSLLYFFLGWGEFKL